MGDFIPASREKASMDIQQIKKATTILSQGLFRLLHSASKLDALLLIQSF
ncbi:hypothetical protein MUS1_06115 [Marinomonas ushuaiensis DSM 15871]|uniref:Uncharacterized protein n=1 Tax=Marinomonas ushuaiensis DSM 15871 TaxID=1122207 RepID=X7E3N0_9GAMM|nr:hypothetical protein MUS1_06115 [Marinomonas ushuaiensis DSM 15871]